MSVPALSAAVVFLRGFSSRVAVLTVRTRAHRVGMAGVLGEDLLHRIVLLLDDPRDLCAAACASRMLKRLTDTAWKPLFLAQPESTNWRGAPETSYKERFREITERQRARARQAELRARLRLESQEMVRGESPNAQA